MPYSSYKNQILYKDNNMKIFLFFVILSPYTFTLSAQSVAEYKSFLIKYEGYKTSVYKDSLGYATVGIGHRITNNEIQKHSHYTNSEIDTLFAADLARALAIANKHFVNFNNLNNNTKLVIVSLCFNLGSGGFAKFRRFIANVNSGNNKGAAGELRNSKWAKQVGNRAKDHIAAFCE